MQLFSMLKFHGLIYNNKRITHIPVPIPVGGWFDNGRLTYICKQE